MSGRTFELSVRDWSADGPALSYVAGWPTNSTPQTRRLLVLVHGFNVTKKSARSSYEEFRLNLVRSLGEGATSRASSVPDVANFHWPGDSYSFLETFFNLGRVYARSIVNGKESAARLAEFLNRLAGPRRVKPIVYFVGHSMGCRLILHLLNDRMSKKPAFPIVKLAALTAAAVPVEFARRGGLLRRGVARVGLQTIVYYSAYDIVLKFAFPAGQQSAYWQGTEFRAYREAIGLVGAPVGFATNQKEMVGYGHKHYWPSPDVAREVAKSLGAAGIHAIPTRRMRGRMATNRRRLVKRVPKFR